MENAVSSRGMAHGSPNTKILKKCTQDRFKYNCDKDYGRIFAFSPIQCKSNQKKIYIKIFFILKMCARHHKRMIEKFRLSLMFVAELQQYPFLAGLK